MVCILAQTARIHFESAGSTAIRGALPTMWTSSKTRMMRVRRKKVFFVGFDFSRDALTEIDGFLRREHAVIRIWIAFSVLLSPVFAASHAKNTLSIFRIIRSAH
jgi:hypothetical protein